MQLPESQSESYPFDVAHGNVEQVNYQWICDEHDEYGDYECQKLHVVLSNCWFVSRSHWLEQKYSMVKEKEERLKRRMRWKPKPTQVEFD